MSKEIPYYLAASAVGVGGLATAKVLLQRGQQEAVAERLRTYVDLATLRKEALTAGVDPDLVEEASRAMRDGRVTIDQIVAWLLTPDNR